MAVDQMSEKAPHSAASRAVLDDNVPAHHSAWIGLVVREPIAHIVVFARGEAKHICALIQRADAADALDELSHKSASTSPSLEDDDRHLQLISDSDLPSYHSSSPTTYRHQALDRG